jgi:protein involved in polysaccharide export with SLBB domain
MTVLQAVTTAEGFTDKASARGTYIIREHSGVKEKVKTGMDDPIRAGDTIVVPESWF